MEPEEEGRKTPLHAYESVEKKIGRSSQGLALEQFFVLLKTQTRIDPSRLRQLMRLQSERKIKPSAPSKNHEGAATRIFKPKGCATRPL
jgi:hypothetical protein